MKRGVFLTSIIWIILPPFVQCTSNSDRNKGLKFSDVRTSYFALRIDMSPFVNKITVCGWLKNLGSRSFPTAFNYGGNDVRLQGDGDAICINRRCLYLKSQVSIPRGIWTHTCLSWSSSSGTLRYYIDGQLVGSKNVGSSSIPTGDYITIGNHKPPVENMFGGEMVNLNMYAKELSGEEIKRLSDTGICSTAVDENEDVRLLKWEDISKNTRTTVTEIDIAEICLEEAQQKVHKITAQQLSESQRILGVCQQTLKGYNKTSGWYWDLFSSDKYINTTISPDVSEQLYSSWDDIADMMIGFTVTDQFITLWKLIDQSDERPWSVLYSERYLNKVFTSEKAESLKTMWDQIGDKLVGVTMTKETVELLKFVSCRDNCEATL